MKKTLLSLGILGILFLGTGNVFAAPMPRPNQAPPRVAKHQPPPPSRISKPPRHVAQKPPRYVAPKPKRHIAHQPQPYYATPVYDPGFALKIGNFILSI